MINQKKFAAIVLASQIRVFLIHIAYLKPKISIYLVLKAQIALLLAKQISSFGEYANFLDVFYKKSAIIFFNCLDINKYVVD